MRSFIYKLFVKHFLPKHRLCVDEYIQDLAGEKYRVEALHYTKDLKPILIVSNQKGEIRSFVDNAVEKTDD